MPTYLCVKCQKNVPINDLQIIIEDKGLVYDKAEKGICHKCFVKGDREGYEKIDLAFPDGKVTGHFC